MQSIGSRNGVAGVKLIAVIAIGVLLAGGGLLAWNTLRAEADEEGEAQSAQEGSSQEETVATETIALGDFLVNLRSSDGALRYLQADVSIVVAAQDVQNGLVDGDGDEDGEELSLPPASHRYARDLTISVLSSQSFEQLRDQPDRSELKAVLQQELDTALTSYEVLDVLFTAFVMQ